MDNPSFDLTNEALSKNSNNSNMSIESQNMPSTSFSSGVDQSTLAKKLTRAIIVSGAPLSLMEQPLWIELFGIKMDIKNNTTLIEALLLAELPNCDEESDAGVSDNEVENLQLPSTRGFDEVFERALDSVLAEVPPSSPSNEDVLECPINQV
ncbi:unnamed protein product [Arctia plantaginis]|uniref:Uncharacterized protein n=1 Tax=Arctia plantaginis TaxID=874455 RepID=A0A8S1AJR3_ARCPL|nr:unnamed protein product [Arctia plantaginis]